MQAKIVLFFLLFATAIQKGNGQVKRHFIQNSSVSYHLVYIGPQMLDSGKAIPSKYIIRTQLNKRERKIIKSIKKDEWITLLHNSQSDWAANLILYDIYEKNAILYNTVIKSKDDWIKVNKEKDVFYWEKFLK